MSHLHTLHQYGEHLDHAFKFFYFRPETLIQAVAPSARKYIELPLFFDASGEVVWNNLRFVTPCLNLRPSTENSWI